MFKPVRMARLLVGGHNAHQEAVIETLHREGAVHLEDYKDEEGLTRIGEPLPAGDQASALLVQVRGLRKALGVEAVFGKALATENPAALLEDAEQAIVPVLDRVSDLRSELARTVSDANALTPFSGLDIDLTTLKGLKSIKGFLGIAKSDPSEALRAAGISHEVDVRPTDHGYAVAVYVPAADASQAETVLGTANFTAATLPKDLHGTPRMVLDGLMSEQTSLEASLSKQEGELARLREAWGARLAALERALTTEVEKTQAPLQFGVTETTFHLEGWVPQDGVNRVTNALTAKFGESLYIQELGDAPAHGHGGSHDGHGEDGHHDDPRTDPPVKLVNKGLAKPYEFLLSLLGRPRYKEIDPTKLMLIFFPLFFGLMVGDMLVGLAIVGVGYYLKKNHIFGIGGPAVGRALVMGGVIAVVAGVFVFGEALGIHFVVDDHAAEEGELSWEQLLGVHFPTEGFIHKTSHSSPDLAHGASAITTHAEEVEEAHSPFTIKPHSDTHLSLNGWVNLGYYSKIHDITALLIWSLIIGLIHLVLGLMIGVRNVYVSHGATLAIQEKASWLMIIAAVPILIWGLGASAPAWALPLGAGVFLAAVVLLWMGVQHTIGVGFIAILEIPSLMGNLLSYTRLAAIGASKAGMAVAFSAIGMLLSGGEPNAVWWIVYIFGMIAITLLAILSGGLQSLRLQFVEFFSKFYEGGGRPYEPFGRRSS